ncbi:hypothetical protein COO60DRAFT_1468031 [Scenedesmus sp. NREL 46B-D3]|nr:hypothetical protein COO60DRAFT_1468031 [Scenedesmus sp. NREL 46B-D3]
MTCSTTSSCPCLDLGDGSTTATLAKLRVKLQFVRHIFAVGGSPLSRLSVSIWALLKLQIEARGASLTYVRADSSALKDLHQAAAPAAAGIPAGSPALPSIFSRATGGTMKVKHAFSTLLYRDQNDSNGGGSNGCQRQRLQDVFLSAACMARYKQGRTRAATPWGRQPAAVTDAFPACWKVRTSDACLTAKHSTISCTAPLQAELQGCHAPSQAAQRACRPRHISCTGPLLKTRFAFVLQALQLGTLELPELEAGDQQGVQLPQQLLCTAASQLPYELRHTACCASCGCHRRSILRDIST